MAKPGTVEDLREWLDKQIGYTESPPGSNRTKYGRAYGMDGYAWCMMFGWQGLTRINVPIIKSAYTPTAADWFRQRGSGFADDSKARPGDLVFFDFPDSTHRIQHVGFVIGNDVAKRTLHTIEGNTASGNAGSQDNGGGVFRRTRPYDHAVYFGRPDYAERPKLDKPDFDFPKGRRAFFTKGDKGGDVKNWQRDLTRYFRHKGIDIGVDVSGEFDQRTLRATKLFQHEKKLDVDGRVGKHTIARMERIRDRQKARKR